MAATATRPSISRVRLATSLSNRPPTGSQTRRRSLLTWLRVVRNTGSPRRQGSGLTDNREVHGPDRQFHAVAGCGWACSDYQCCRRRDRDVSNFKNTRNGTIIIEKEAVGGDGNTTFYFTSALGDFSLKPPANGTANPPKTFDNVTPGGPYTVTKQRFRDGPQPSSALTRPPTRHLRRQRPALRPRSTRPPARPSRAGSRTRVTREAEIKKITDRR